MSFRGRGRGRGRFGGGGFYVREEPFVVFPEIELPDPKDVKEERALVIWNSRLINFWKSSPYYLDESVKEKSQSMDIERYSDWGKSKGVLKRDPLDGFIKRGSKNFPKELDGDHSTKRGSKRAQPTPKKVRWNPDSDLQKLDIFEKLEQKYQGQEEKGEKEKKEGQEEEDEDGDEAEAEEEISDDDDYNQNIDFDDDEDDFNMDDGNDDEPIY